MTTESALHRYGGIYGLNTGAQPIPRGTVNGDNTIALDNRVLQIEKTRWRNTLAGCKVTVYEHLNGTMLVRFGPHEVARFAAGQVPAPAPRAGQRRFSPRRLGHKRTVAT